MTGILWGAIAAHLFALSLGILILFPLRLRLTLGERWAAAVACGIPAIVVLVQALAAMGLFRRGVVQILVILCVLSAGWLCRGAKSEPSTYSGWVWLAILPIWAWSASTAIGPDLTPPGEDYALAAAHRFVSRYAAPPWDIGAAYAVPYLLGRHSAVALFHASLLLPAAAAIGRFGWLAMVLFVAHPGLITLASRAGSADAFTLSLLVAGGSIALALIRRDSRFALPAVLAAAGAYWAWPGSLEVFPGFVFLKTPWWLAPLLACGLGWLVQPVRPAAFALAAFAMLTGWPPVTTILAPPGTRPTAGAGMVEARFLDLLPANATVLSDIPMPGAWVPRRLAPRPDWLDEARRVAAAQWGVRTLPFQSSGVVQVNPEGFVGEVVLLVDGRELPRQPRWRVWPPGAFDGLPFTGSAGPVRIDTGQGPLSGELRIIGTEGEEWAPSIGLRRNVVLEWKRRGISHVLVSDPLLVVEFSAHAEYWGVDALGERGTARLYALR